MVDDRLKRFYQLVKFSPCLACGKPGPSEAAHVALMAGLKDDKATRSHKGLSAYSAIPLCYECHRGPGGIHSGREDEWLDGHIRGGRLGAAGWIIRALATLYNEGEDE